MINQRARFCLFTAFFLGGLTGQAFAAVDHLKPPRPNIILVLSDDQGFGDVGVHGNRQIRTPNLDRFANEGIRLNRFYCSPVCAPTRASLLTGRYYYRTGVIHTSRGGARMHTDEVTLAEHLAAAGYATGIFGKWHLGDNYPMRPADQGFAQSLVHKSGGIGQTPDRPNSYFNSLLWRNNHPHRAQGYCTDVFFQAALQFIEQHRESPFFVYLALNAPHTPLEIDEKYVRPYQQQGLDDTTARVYGMLENLDENMARLLTRLDNWSLRKNTLVIFAGDNGPQQRRFNAGLKGRKSSVYEGGIRTPCFVQWPKRLPGNRVLQQLTSHIDLAATILDAAQVELRSKPNTPKLDGQSVLAHWESERPTDERMRFFQCHRGLMPQRFQNCAVLTQRYKLVANATSFSNESFRASDPPQWELYDILADPGEAHDLAADRTQVVRRLSKAYEAWFRDVEAARKFQPPRIVIGASAAPITHLCRYQDAFYQYGKPTGWPVRIRQNGVYRLTLKQSPLPADALLHVRWRGESHQLPISAAQPSIELPLAQGAGRLDIWTQVRDKPRQYIVDNSTQGDIVVERIR